MVLTTSRLMRYQRRFLVAFVASAFAFLVSWSLSVEQPSAFDDTVGLVEPPRPSGTMEQAAKAKATPEPARPSLHTEVGHPPSGEERESIRIEAANSSERELALGKSQRGDMPPPARDAALTAAAGFSTADLISSASLATSGTTLLGFFITTFLAWGKETREALRSDLEREKMRLEIEKLRADLAPDRRSASQEPPTPGKAA